MKKSTLILLVISFCIGEAAFSQDTIRLFGHQKNTNPEQKSISHNHKKTVYVNSGPNSEIRTITGRGHSIGFEIGFNGNCSQINGYDAFGAGGSFAIIANHGLAIGFAGKGFFTEPYPISASSTTKDNYSGGYGGLLIEPILFPKWPVHLSFPVILGVGGIAKSILYDYTYPYEFTQIEVQDASAFMVVEPGVELEINIARWLRLGLGCSYRFTSDLEPVVFDTKIMDGLTTGFSLKIGKF